VVAEGKTVLVFSEVFSVFFRSSLQKASVGNPTQKGPLGNDWPSRQLMGMWKLLRCGGSASPDSKGGLKNGQR
jgi:hypothetical protein